MATYVERLESLVADDPDAAMLTFGDAVSSRAEILARARDLAVELVELGVDVDDMVTIAEPNSVEFVVALFACWMIGAIPQPVSSQLPRHELDAIVDLADARAVLGLEFPGRAWLPQGHVARPAPDSTPPFEGRIASSWKAPTSGGSTGRPKLIVATDPPTWTEGNEMLAVLLGARPGWTMVMPGPLYHNGPLVWACHALLNGTNLALLPRFDAEETLATIQRTGAESLYVVPTMMQRISKLPDALRDGYDVSTLKVVFHIAEPCPAWVKEAWIDWLGPEVVWEMYAGTEAQAATVIDGATWLERKGSVGRCVAGEVKVCDDDGNELPPGEIGQVWMRSTNRSTPTYRYIGAETDARDGWDSLGDMGSLDPDGFLYLADRRTDMILVGGANVYPAEVEAALNSHPAVHSSAVIGLPDSDKGNRVHAIVQADEVSIEELAAHLAGLLVRYKLPRTYEFVTEPLRNDAGKVRRSALRADRLGT